MQMEIFFLTSKGRNYMIYVHGNSQDLMAYNLKMGNHSPQENHL